MASEKNPSRPLVCFNFKKTHTKVDGNFEIWPSDNTLLQWIVHPRIKSIDSSWPFTQSLYHQLSLNVSCSASERVESKCLPFIVELDGLQTKQCVFLETVSHLLKIMHGACCEDVHGGSSFFLNH